jgi:DNA-binding CsgD family transcriptional regulator
MAHPPTRAVAIDACVTDCYRAASGLLDWSAALRGLADLLHADRVLLHGVSRPCGTPLLDAAAEAARPAEAAHAAASGRPARDAGRAEREIASTLLEDERRVVRFAALRAADRAPFGRRERDAAHRLRRHLAAAVRIALDRPGPAAAMPLDVAILERSLRPSLLVRADGHVLHANGAGREALRRGDCLVDVGGRLGLAHPPRNDALAAALQGQAGDRAARPGASPVPRTRLLTSVARSDGATVLVRVEPRVHRDAGGHAIALVTLHDTRRAPSIDPALLQQAFALTPAESRIALMLAAGTPAAGIAAAQGIAISTVRTHLRGILSKLGVRRQLDLVRMLADLSAV